MSEDNRWHEQHMRHIGLHPEYAWVQQQRPPWTQEFFRCCTGETLAAPELVAPSFQKVPIRRYNARQIRASWSRAVGLVRQGLIDDKLHFYLHFPFCAQRCRYCCWFGQPLGSESEIEGFLHRTQQQFRYFKETFSGIRFKSLYIGGGTPSLLSAGQMLRLMAEFHRCFGLSPDAFVATECNPVSVTEEKIQAMKDAGFTRINLGVQTFDPALLRSSNRGYQNEAIVARAVDILKRADFRNGFTGDLLAGLEGQPPSDLLSSFDKLAAMGAPSIAVNLLQPTPTYGNTPRFRRNLERFTRCLLEELPPWAAKKGYEYWPMFGEKGPLRAYQDFGYVRRDAPAAYKTEPGVASGSEPMVSPLTYGSIFGMGPMARATIAGTMFYHETPQKTGDFDPAAPLYEGSALDRESQVLWHAVSRFDAGRQVTMRDLNRLLGRDARPFMAPFLAALQKAGRIQSVRGRMTSRKIGRDRLPCVCSIGSAWARAFVKKNLDLRQQVSLGESAKPWIVDIEDIRARKPYSLRLGGLGFLVTRKNGETLPEIAEELARSIRRLSRASAETIPASCLGRRASFIALGLRKEFPKIAAGSREAARRRAQQISALEEALRAVPRDWPRRGQIERILSDLRARDELSGPTYCAHE